MGRRDGGRYNRDNLDNRLQSLNLSSFFFLIPSLFFLFSLLLSSLLALLIYYNLYLILPFLSTYNLKPVMLSFPSSPSLPFSPLLFPSSPSFPVLSRSFSLFLFSLSVRRSN